MHTCTLCGHNYFAADEISDRPCDACVQKALKGCTPVARRHARKATLRVVVVLLGIWTCVEVIRAGWEGRDAALAMGAAGSLAFYAAVSLAGLLSVSPEEKTFASVAHPAETGRRLHRALRAFARKP